MKKFVTPSGKTMRFPDSATDKEMSDALNAFMAQEESQRFQKPPPAMPLRFRGQAMRGDPGLVQPNMFHAELDRTGTREDFETPLNAFPIADLPFDLTVGGAGPSIMARHLPLPARLARGLPGALGAAGSGLVMSTVDSYLEDSDLPVAAKIPLTILSGIGADMGITGLASRFARTLPKKPQDALRSRLIDIEESTGVALPPQATSRWPSLAGTIEGIEGALNPFKTHMDLTYQKRLVDQLDALQREMFEEVTGFKPEQITAGVAGQKVIAGRVQGLQRHLEESERRYAGWFADIPKDTKVPATRLAAELNDALGKYPDEQLLSQFLTMWENKVVREGMALSPTDLDAFRRGIWDATYGPDRKLGGRLFEALKADLREQFPSAAVKLEEAQAQSKFLKGLKDDPALSQIARVGAMGINEVAIFGRIVQPGELGVKNVRMVDKVLDKEGMEYFRAGALNHLLADSKAVASIGRMKGPIGEDVFYPIKYVQMFEQYRDVLKELFPPEAFTKMEDLALLSKAALPALSKAAPETMGGQALDLMKGGVLPSLSGVGQVFRGGVTTEVAAAFAVPIASGVLLSKSLRNPKGTMRAIATGRLPRKP